jgi:hypothetical protein
MTTSERVVWLVGLAAIIGTVVYWPTIKSAWKNRKTISEVSDIFGALNVGGTS